MIFIEINQDKTYFQRALDGNTFKITKLKFEKPTSYQTGQYEPMEFHKQVSFTIKTDINTDTEDKIVYLISFVICSDNDSIVYDYYSNQNLNALKKLEEELLKRTEYIHQRIVKEIKNSHKIQKIEDQFK